VNRFACLPGHKDLRYNLLSTSFSLQDRSVLVARRALRLLLRTVVGDKVDSWEYRLDQNLNLSWVIEFFYRISALFGRITSPEIFADGTVAPVPTQAEHEQFFWRPNFASGPF
jgi:hypothetical protein